MKRSVFEPFGNGHNPCRGFSLNTMLLLFLMGQILDADARGVTRLLLRVYDLRFTHWVDHMNLWWL